jgi:hypothetical protein
MSTETARNREVASGEPLDVETMLNKKGFAEFLAEQPDAENLDLGDLNDQGVKDRISAQFEAFERKENASKESVKVAKEIRDLLSKQIEAETGLKLTPKQLERVDQRVKERARDNPEWVLDASEQIKKFRELPAEISAAKGRLAEELGEKDLEEIEREIDRLRRPAELAKDSKPRGRFKLGFMRLLERADLWKDLKTREAELEAEIEKIKEDKGPAAGERREALKKQLAVMAKQKEAEDYIDRRGWKAFQEAGAKLKNLEKQKLSIETIQTMISDLETQFDSIQSVVKSELVDVGEFREVARAEAEKQLRSLIDVAAKRKTEVGYQAVKDFVERLEEGREFSGYDYLAGFGMTPDVVKRTSELAIAEIVERQLVDTAAKVSTGDNAFNKTVTLLKPFFERREIGSMEDDGARAFVVGTLGAEVNKLKTDKKTLAKALIISAAIAKLSKG